MSDPVIMRVIFPGSPGIDYLTNLEDDFEGTQFDVSVAAQPQLAQWALTASHGGITDVGHGSDLWHELQAYLDKFGVHDQPVAVEVLSMVEYERRSEAPTLPVLVGAAEVADLLGVSRQRVHQLRSGATFPAPLVEVAMGPLWDERAIEKFAHDWSRLPGRPRTVSR